MERLSKAMGAAWFSDNFSPIHRKFRFTRKQKWLVGESLLPDIYKALKLFLTLKLSQYHKIGSTLSSSELVAASRLENTLTWLCVCACLSNQPKLWTSAASRAWPLILQSKPSIVFCNTTQTWTLPPDHWVAVISYNLLRKPEESSINCVEFEFFLERHNWGQLWVDTNPKSIIFRRWRWRGFVPMPYFYSETNEFSKDWAKQWALLWLVTTSFQFHQNFILHEKQKTVTAENL